MNKKREVVESEGRADVLAEHLAEEYWCLRSTTAPILDMLGAPLKVDG